VNRAWRELIGQKAYVIVLFSFIPEFHFHPSSQPSSLSDGIQIQSAFYSSLKDMTTNKKTSRRSNAPLKADQPLSKGPVANGASTPPTQETRPAIAPQVHVFPSYCGWLMTDSFSAHEYPH
jgi:hypothetical protein